MTSDFAEDHGLEVGAPLTLTFLAGKSLDLEVVGVIEGSEVTGEVSVPIDLLADAGVPRQDTSLSITLKMGADPATVGEALDKATEPIPLVDVYDKQGFADSIRGQVNQLLYMIYGAAALAIMIAVIGIVNTLGLSVLERTREIGLLRSIGMTRRQLRLMITLESVAIAVLGAVLGMALGLLFGMLLQRALETDLTSQGLHPSASWWSSAVIAVVVGVLAAVIPAIGPRA